MIYRNGKDSLPAELLCKIQEYVEGELIYIPRRNERRAGWGVVNGTKKKLEMRNQEIGCCYRNGLSVFELAIKFHLSEDSIRKVLQKQGASNELEQCKL